MNAQQLGQFRLVFPLVLLVALLWIPQFGYGQYTTSACQTVSTALIGPDRNDWAHANLPIVNEGYLHNFDPPTLPCGLNSPNITSLVVNINITNITTDPGCNMVPIFGNVLFDCDLTTTAICPIVQDVLSTGCVYFPVD